MLYLDKWKIKVLDINGADMPDSEYFKLKGYTSVSRLKLLDPDSGGSPDQYLSGFSQEYNESLALGTAVHCHILQPDDFEISPYRGKPAGKLGFFIDKVFYYRQQKLSILESIEKASVAANYYNNKMTPKLIRNAMEKGLDYYIKLTTGYFNNTKETIVLSQRLLDAYYECVKSLKNNHAIRSMLQNQGLENKQFFNEIALFSNIEVTFPDGKKHVIKFKGKLDSVVYNEDTSTLYLNDVKTTSKSLNYFMDVFYEGKVCPGVFSHHAYYFQLAAYSILLQKYFQEVLHLNYDTFKCNILAVETTNQFRSDIFRINNSYINLGIAKFKELLCRLAYHEVYGFDKEFRY